MFGRRTGSHRSRLPVSRRSRAVRWFLLLVAAVTGWAAAGWMTGCTAPNQNEPTTKPSSAYERSEGALRDPFHYSPEMDKPDISGGDIGELDRQGMRKDIDHVLNP